MKIESGKNSSVWEGIFGLILRLALVGNLIMFTVSYLVTKSVNGLIFYGIFSLLLYRRLEKENN